MCMAADNCKLQERVDTIGGKAIKAPEGGGKIIFPARQFEVC